MRIYRWLLWFSPKTLRRDYGEAMEETFAQRLSDARGGSSWRTMRLWWCELTGLLLLAVSEHWSAVTRERDGFSRAKGRSMDGIGREIRHAARRLVKSPTFTLAAVLTLALAIGANASIFTVVQRVVLNPLPYPDSNRLIALDYGIPAKNMASGMNSMTWQLHFQFVDHAQSLAAVGSV